MATVIRSETHPGVEKYEDVNRDLLRLLGKPGRGYFMLLGAAIALVIVGATAFLVQVCATRSAGVCTSRPSSSGSASRIPGR